jgi:hypothetical protein
LKIEKIAVRRNPRSPRVTTLAGDIIAGASTNALRPDAQKFTEAWPRPSALPADRLN